VFRNRGVVHDVPELCIRVAVRPRRRRPVGVRSARPFEVDDHVGNGSEAFVGICSRIDRHESVGPGMRIRENLTVIRNCVASLGRLIEEVSTNVVPGPKVRYVTLDIGHRPRPIVGVYIPDYANTLVSGGVDGFGERRNLCRTGPRANVDDSHRNGGARGGDRRPAFGRPEVSRDSKALLDTAGRRTSAEDADSRGHNTQCDDKYHRSFFSAVGEAVHGFSLRIPLRTLQGRCIAIATVRGTT
jgi:hypothetical protein